MTTPCVRKRRAYNSHRINLNVNANSVLKLKCVQVEHKDKDDEFVWKSIDEMTLQDKLVTHLFNIDTKALLPFHQVSTLIWTRAITDCLSSNGFYGDGDAYQRVIFNSNLFTLEKNDVSSEYEVKEQLSSSRSNKNIRKYSGKMVELTCKATIMGDDKKEPYLLCIEGKFEDKECFITENRQEEEK